MNEVDPADKTDFAAKPPMVATIALLSVFHFFCCGFLLLLLSGVSLAAIMPSLSVLGGGMALLGIVGFAAYLSKGRAACSHDERPGNGRKCEP